ncbi:hypothetical protein M9Y10_030956 [Tritrichomonas musculus]|uniref:Protein kinase domain-containing protein n=1 Tax=Tritrichomonas musculus TaxID=1915356 RepID=A0ABR2H4K5_9EUKA
MNAEEQSNDNKAYIQNYLLDYLKNYKFITYQFRDINFNDEILIQNDKINYNSHLINTIICIEKECIIIEQINISLITHIIETLKKQHLSIINVNNKKGNLKYDDISIIDETCKFCESFVQEIIQNRFVEITLPTIAGFLIRRHFCPTNYFKDQSFFFFNEESILKEEETKKKMVDFLFSKSSKDFNTFNDQFMMLISEFDNSNCQINHQEFNEKEFIKLRQIYSNEKALFYLAIHYETLQVFMMKKLQKEDRQTLHEIDFCKNYSSRYMAKFYGFMTENEKTTGFIYRFMSKGSLSFYDDEIDELCMLTTISRIFQGINYLQDNCLIHRDLKPANILIDHDKIFYISDFETIRHPLNPSEKVPNEEITNNIGSPIYSSPEQNQGGYVSYPADIYSFGFVIYFLIVREKIKDLDLSFLDGKSEINLMIPNHISKNISDLIRSCIKIDPNQRITKNQIVEKINNEINSFHYFEQCLLKDLDKINKPQVVQFIYESILFQSSHHKDMTLFIENVFYFQYIYSLKEKGDIPLFYINLGNFYFNDNDYLTAKKYFEIAASFNNPKAFYFLGNLYFNGNGVDIDYNKARYYYELAAEQNDKNSLYNLGVIYFNGKGIQRDYSKARYYYELAAEQNDKNSLYNLGVIYFYGKGIQRDYSKARHYFELAAEQNDSESFNYLGNIYKAGLDIPINYSKAIHYFELAANQNNPNALCNLGVMYLEGLGVSKDYMKAKNYFELSANLNFSDGLCNLGHMYEDGLCVRQDFTKARECYELASQQNNSKALLKLGYLYSRGLGVQPNIQIAIKYYELSAQLDNIDAICNLGALYLTGDRIQRDFIKAKYYFELGASMNDSECINHLGEIYQNGLGVSPNLEMAKHYYERSSNLGYSPAINHLGEIYHIEKNYNKALKYYEKAIQMNNSDSMVNLASLYFNGQGVKQDNNRTLYYLESAAKLNNHKALNNLGTFYLDGIIVEQNYLKAFNYFERSSKFNNVCAYLNLGFCYLNGFGVNKDYLKAKKYYEKAASYKNSKAFAYLANLYADGLGVEKNYEKAIYYYQLAINQDNNPIALNNLGDFYRKGFGVKQDFLKAKELYEKAVKLGNSTSMNNLGSLYKYGLGVDQDYSLAKKYYELGTKCNNSDSYLNLGAIYYLEKNYVKSKEYIEKAANMNNLNANLFLGYFYFRGFGVDQDFVKARKYFESSSDDPALLYLATIYCNGLGTPKDGLKAKYYYEILAKRENPLGFLFLGIMYCKGIGVEQDYLKAKNYYESAAKLKNSNAMINLGDLYRNGYGVNKDYSKAKEYYELAARSYNSHAFVNLGHLYRKGYFVEKDIKTAIHYYEFASYQKNPISFFHLADLYSTGDSIPVNLNKAIYYFSKNIEIPYQTSFVTSLNPYLYRSYNDLGLIYLTFYNDVDKANKFIKEAAFAEYPFGQNNFGLINLFYLNNVENAEYMFVKASKHNFALAEFNLGYLKERQNKIEEAIEFYINASQHESEPLIYRHKKYHDKRLDISKMFIICFTNLKLTDFFIEKEDIEKAIFYFNKTFSKLNSNSYKFQFHLNENDFSYLCKFILEFPLFNQSQLDQENDKIFNDNNFQSSPGTVFSDPSELFDFAVKNNKSKLIETIKEIIHTIEKKIYKPPYSILFGRISIEKSSFKDKRVTSCCLRNINEMFYEGLQINEFSLI